MSKIVGVGWAKTGTTTLGKCFRILGYKHQSRRFDLVHDLERGDLTRILAVASEKDTFEDWPWILIYKQFDEFFSGSKFVLTVREPDKWLQSYKGMLQREGSANERRNRLRTVIYGVPFRDASDQQLIDRYLRHNEEVRE